MILYEAGFVMLRPGISGSGIYRISGTVNGHSMTQALASEDGLTIVRLKRGLRACLPMVVYSFGRNTSCKDRVGTPKVSWWHY